MRKFLPGISFSSGLTLGRPLELPSPYFTVVTNRFFVENIRRLALMEAMSTNDFVVKVLSEKMIEALQNDPLLYRKNIPDY